jgi:hypothetical protein
VLNEVPEGLTPLVARRGAGTRGKQRTTVEIVSEPLLHDFDENVLGAEPAVAIRDLLERETKNVEEPASKATLAIRAKSARALEAGASWAKRRYSGGRTGTKPPNQTIRKLNDSGRLAEGWFVRENKEDRAWTVNVPANRLSPEVFGARWEWFLGELRRLVKPIGDVRAIGADKGFQSAVTKSIAGLIIKGELRGDSVSVRKLQQLSKARKQALLAAIRAAMDLLR